MNKYTPFPHSLAVYRTRRPRSSAPIVTLRASNLSRAVSDLLSYEIHHSPLSLLCPYTDASRVPTAFSMTSAVRSQWARLEAVR